MSYPQQQKNQRYSMPMPQSIYPSYGHQPPYQSQGHSSVPYPSQGGNRPPPYPLAANTGSSKLPYSPNVIPTSQVQNLSMSSMPPYSTNISQSQQTPYLQSSTRSNQSQISSEVDGWIDGAINTLLAMFKDARQEELNVLVNNEDKLNEFVQSAEEVKKLKQKREEFIQSNKDQAVTNLSLEPELDVLKTSIIQLAQEQNELKEKYCELQQKIAGNVSIDQISVVLQVETEKSESESDKISHNFLNNGSGEDIDEFLENYISKRATYQLRKVKSEKMTQLLTGDVVSADSNQFRTRVPMPSQRPPQAYGGYGGY